MDRRGFIRNAGAGMAGILAAGAAPAFAQGAPEIKWRLASSFPKSLDTIYGAAETMSKRVAACTGGKFQIQVFAAGEIVPGLQVLDAVQNGTVEAGHTAPYYYWGKDAAFALDTAIPFSLNARQTNAWQIFGGGNELFADFYKGYNIYRIPCGNTGAQMGGWYRKEIKTVADLKGLKFRIGDSRHGDGKLGWCPNRSPVATSIRPREGHGRRGRVGRPVRRRSSASDNAKYYYYPGFWEGGPQLVTMVNMAEWAKLSKEYQNTQAACWGHVDGHKTTRRTRRR